MRVSVIQMNQGSDKAANLAQARRLVEAAVEADRPGLVTLPETWTNLGGGRDSRKAAAEVLPPEGSGEPGGPAYEMLRGLAQTHGVHVHGGSMIEDGAEKLFAHEAVIRLRRVGSDGEILVQIEAGHARKIEAFFAMQPNQFAVDPDGSRAGRQTQNRVGLFPHQLRDARRHFAANGGVVGVNGEGRGWRHRS